MIERLRATNARRFIVAYSGGVDSSVLLHAAHDLFGDRVWAFHVNHGLSQKSGEWQSHCADTCEVLGIPFSAVAVEVSREGSLEEKARIARYEAYQNVVGGGDVLLQAHHGHDQVETVLMMLFRGSARPGVVGMPMSRKIGKGILLRPLLDRRRVDLEQYARTHGLTWIEDESNSDTTHRRNLLRNRIMPLIEEGWPGAAEAILAGVSRTEKFSQLIENIGENDHQMLLGPRGGLSVAGVSALPPLRARNAIRAWVRSLALPSPPEAILEVELDKLLIAAEDAAPLLSWQGVSLRRFGGEIYLTGAVIPDPPAESISIKEASSVSIAGGNLSAETVKGRGVVLQGHEVHVRFRRGGETLKQSKRRSIKNLQQESGTPTWLRPLVPLVCVGEEIVAIAALPDWGIPMVVSSGWEASEGETGLEFSFQFPNQPYSH